MSGLRWGILATGWIAELFTADLIANDLTVVAVGSRSQEKADAFAQRFGIPTAYGSYAELVADPNVDVIYVATPHPMHYADVTLALDAGKHVLVEKAITVNARQARELVELARSKNLLFLEAMWTRFLPHMVRIREILAAGTLGTVYSLTADHTQDLPDDPHHRINALELGGGATLDLGIYPISLAWMVFGKPESVVARARFKDTGADASVATIFQYADGALATTISTSDTRGPNTAVILGTEGSIEIEGVWYTATNFKVLNSVGEVIETYTSDVIGRGMQYEAFEVEDLVARGEIASSILSPDESVAIMETLDEIRAQIGLTYPGE